jgi:hypothetical protein
MSKEQKDLEIKANDLGKELGDNEIEAASGGGACGCAFGGLGSEDAPGEGHDDFCGCALAGAGVDDRCELRCACPVTGFGMAL